MTAEPVILQKRCRHGDMRFIRDDFYIGHALDIYGEFSELEAQLFEQLVQPGQVVVEAGANIGAHTVHLARLVGPGGMVMAFEPQRAIYDLLCANAKLNGMDNIHPFLGGMGARQEMMQVPPLDYGKNLNFGGVSLQRGTAGEDVPVVPLDALNLPALHLLKIDVEGMEAEVLEGARQTIARHRPALYVENDRAEHSARLIALVESFGYAMWWHLPALFNPDNFAGNTDNIYGETISVNMLCLPGELQTNINGMRKVSGPDDTWRSRGATP